MSGFEVAGVVLGSLPLVISAVEAYMNFLKDWASELRSIHRDLKTERTRLYNVCEQLLLDIVPAWNIEPMLQDPMGPLWQIKEANDKIRRVLCNSYGPFEVTVAEVKDAIDNLAQRLKIDITRDGQVEWVNKGRMTREFKKFLFRVNRKDYQEALATISKGIGHLEWMARFSVSLEPARQNRVRGRVLDILRDLSTSIYRALCYSILCSDSHDVSLELGALPIDVGYEDEDEKVVRSVQFTIAVSFEAHDGPARKRFWDEMSIKTARPLNQAPMSKTPPRCTSPPIVSRSNSNKPEKTKSVSFMLAQKLSLVSSIRSPTPDVKVAIASLAQHATKVAFVDTSLSDADRTTGPLVDLCLALHNARKARPACYGHLIDKDYIDRCFQVYPRGTTASSDTWSIVTLRDVLEQKDGLHPLASLKQKIRLASLSPRAKNVHFFKRSQYLSYEHPFLQRNFPERSSSPSPSASHPPATMISERNPTLFALGIMLLEIMLGSTLDALRAPHERDLVFPDDERGVIRDLVTAHRLLEQRVALINPRYKVVVERCMECTALQDLDEENFRREVYSRVVSELEAILGHTSLGG
ncbi:hypothetical protein QBC43DRAFT_356135 [Cladorrhinum sp. PSN259]|nr:hypothetical protein QBC43DRAFT_356135 [Cladorrhinum sp. PSN259]